jgi:mevalonate kinase
MAFNGRTIPGLSIRVRSQGIPIGAGLGSSAAYSVALSGALIRLREKFINIKSSEISDEGGMPYPMRPSANLLKIINDWAYKAEMVIHGTPSGLDNTTSCYGGVVKYDKIRNNFETILTIPTIDILLTNTKVPRSTKVLVAYVRALYEKYPNVIKPILNSIEAISLRFLELVDMNR